MIKFGTRRAGNGRKSRTHIKFPRGAKKVKNFEGTRLGMRVNRWVEPSITARHVRRFLLSNIGRLVDKVFSEFIKRCDKSIYNPKEIFYSYIEKKEEIDPRWGGFYVTNGILNYKKKKEPQKKEVPLYNSYVEFNNGTFPNDEALKLICNKALRDGLTLVGKFYVFLDYRRGTRLRNVFIRSSSSFAGFFKFRTVEVIGIGRYLYKHLKLDRERGLYTKVERLNYIPYDPSNDKIFEFIIKEE